MKPRIIAILDDDADMAGLMACLLKAGDRKIISYASPGKFLDSIKKTTPDLLVLDMNLPGISGRDLLMVLRNNPATAKMPVLAVSGSLRDTSEVVSGLETGADDYMLKPFDNVQFTVRVESLMRRAEESKHTDTAEEKIFFGPLEIGLESHTVLLGGDDVKLTALEFDLLLYFIRQRNRVVTRGTLLITSGKATRRSARGRWIKGLKLSGRNWENSAGILKLSAAWVI